MTTVNPSLHFSAYVEEVRHVGETVVFSMRKPADEPAFGPCSDREAWSEWCFEARCPLALLRGETDQPEGWKGARIDLSGHFTKKKKGRRQFDVTAAPMFLGRGPGITVDASKDWY